MTYQVGWLLDLSPNDAKFDRMIDATMYALGMGLRPERQPVGIWEEDDDGLELVRIVWQGEVFEK